MASLSYWNTPPQMGLSDTTSISRVAVSRGNIETTCKTNRYLLQLKAVGHRSLQASGLWTLM